jgi:hypothetical protein
VTWAPDYLTPADAKAYLRVDDAVDDAQIATAITGASRAIDRACGRQFGVLAAAEDRVYQAEYDRHATPAGWIVQVDDVATATGMVVKVGTTVVTQYSREPLNAVTKGGVWTSIRFATDDAEAQPDDEPSRLVTVTAQWGWASVPSAITHACKIQTSRFLARRDSPFGIAGSPADGSELRLLARVDPDVAVLVRPYRRIWAVV